MRASPLTCRPGLSSTTAFTASPHFSSGTAITAQSCTAGWLQITRSISMGKTLSPPAMSALALRWLRAATVLKPSAPLPSMRQARSGS